MKKWIIWTGLIVIILASAGTFLGFKASAGQSHLANADKIESQWEKGDIHQKAIRNMTEQLKQNQTIHAANAMAINTTDVTKSVKEKQKFTGALQVQTQIKKGLSNKEQIKFGRELLDLLFANEQVKDISLSIFQNGDSQGFIKITANKSDFKDRDKDNITSGISQLTMMNPTSNDKG